MRPTPVATFLSLLPALVGAQQAPPSYYVTGATGGLPVKGQASQREVVSAAREVSLSLVNLIPAAEAARSRSHRYRADITPISSSEHALVAVVDLEEFGWNAIGVHRRVPGLTCTVRTGTVGPLLGGPSEGWEPWCVGPDGEPVPVELKANDKERVRWWHDPFLEAAPERKECRAFALPQAPTRNDTLYLSFPVEANGRVGREPIIIESTASLVESSSALTWLAGCSFRPARVEGKSVRSFVHLAYPLAPSIPGPPSRPPTEGASEGSVAMAQWYARAMVGALNSLAAAQDSHRTRTGRYAASVAALGRPLLTTDSSTWVAITGFSDSGYRAIAARWWAPDVMCSLTVIWGPTEASVTCRDSQSSREFPVDPRNPGVPTSSSLAQVAGPGGGFIAQPPMRQACTDFRRLRNTPPAFEVVVEVVIDVTGLPDARTLRILESSGLDAAAAATRWLGHCRYTPASHAGRAIPVMIRQPINYNTRE